VLVRVRVRVRVSVEVSVLPLSMYLCVEDIGFTVKPISSTHKYIERGQIDILNTQIHRKR
jgi:hypothetical protein